MIHKAVENNNALSRITVKVTPEQLRVIANRIEAQSKNTLPGNLITYDFTKDILFMFDPELTLERFERNLLSQSELNARNERMTEDARNIFTDVT